MVLRWRRDRSLECHEANSTLALLHLGLNQIGDGGTTALADALRATLVKCIVLVRTECSYVHDEQGVE